VEPVVPLGWAPGLAGRALPPVERPDRQLNEAGPQQPDVQRSLGAVVAVERRERLVELSHERLTVPRRGPELDEPVVAPARLARRGIAGCDGELSGLRARPATGDHQGLLDLLDDHVLAERVAEMARPPADHPAHRIPGSE